MGWTKHPDAVQAYQSGRKEALSSVRKLTKALKQELQSPSDIHGQNILELGRALHSDLRRFVSFRRGVGGDEDVDTQPYVDLLLEVFTNFKWSVHVR